MLERDLAESLLLLVNNTYMYDDLLSYIKHRITEAHRELEACVTHDDLMRAQGKVRELRHILKLKEEVLAVGNRREA